MICQVLQQMQINAALTRKRLLVFQLTAGAISLETEMCQRHSLLQRGGFQRWVGVCWQQWRSIPVSREGYNYDIIDMESLLRLRKACYDYDPGCWWSCRCCRCCCVLLLLLWTCHKHILYNQYICIYICVYICIYICIYYVYYTEARLKAICQCIHFMA